MLYPTGIILILISVSTFYYTSTKIEINKKNKLVLQLVKQKIIVRILGTIAGLGSIYFFDAEINFLSAIFATSVLWMGIASLFTLFAPSIKTLTQYVFALSILIILFSMI